MAEEPGFFRFSLDRGGILIPSDGFSLVAIGSGISVLPDADGREKALFPFGSRDVLRIETLFQAFFPAITTAPASAAPSLLYRHSADGKPLGGPAFLVDRDFEVITLPLTAFALPPQGLRAALGRKGLIALRFLQGTGMDLLIDPDRAIKTFSLVAAG